jgi:hypothetical protein
MRIRARHRAEAGMIVSMWRVVAVLALVAVVFKVIEALAVVAVIVGCLAVAGHVVIRLWDRQPALVGAADVEPEPCCHYRDHEGEAAVCGCTNHPRSYLHPFGDL